MDTIFLLVLLSVAAPSHSSYITLIFGYNACLPWSVVFNLGWGKYISAFAQSNRMDEYVGYLEEELPKWY